MKKNQGFTLVELIGVIVVIAIIITAATVSIISVISKMKKSANEIMKENLSDAAVSYSLEYLDLTECADGFDPENTQVCDNECCTFVTVKELKDTLFFEDEQKKCKEDGKVLIYDFDNKVYIKDNDICQK